ncbi:D-tyrosyl-tRNA(Tyr) deacylase [Sutterella massiliensis]|uniref:D-aminoacyl-tRNA deacylase n=1 Tax=Sutterella massiliensis TaxID=1816689 RepID=A0ABS2DRK8_9BURK|nr:D-aminoacyl-tRNA deacylase [Sutterella massiliensis]MBM6703360.1 D-tyrosyl-tRNA(Tyr) deacylase [Sutterella massiliensis]
MIVLLQRVIEAAVRVEGREVGRTGPGYLALVCAEPEDTDETVRKAAQKTVKLRVFADEAGKMNRSIRDTGGSILAVSQFTLAADCLSGNRPSFSRAAPPDVGLARFNDFVAALRAEGIAVETGEFGAEMQVSLVNDGPATFWLRF